MKIKKLILLLTCFIACWGCHEEEALHPLLEVSKSTFLLGNSKETAIFDITSNLGWKLTSKVAWCDVSTPKGRGNDRVAITVEANDGEEEREGKVILEGMDIKREITVSQSALKLEIKSTSLNYGVEGGRAVVQIFSNAAWKIINNNPWIKINPLSGRDSADLEVVVEPNQTDIPQNSYFTVECGKKKSRIEVTQAGIQLALDTTSLYYEKQGGEGVVNITTNANWTVTCDVDWCHVSKQSGKGNGQITIRVDPSTSQRLETTDVSINSGTISRVIHVGTYGDMWQEGEVRLYRSEDKGNPVKLIFMGDGFITEDMEKGGAYDQAMEEAIEAFLANEPYKTYRNYFCPYIVYAYSKDRGMSIVDGKGGFMVKKNTAFNTHLLSGASNMGTDNEKALEYGRRVPGLKPSDALTITLAVNDPTYGGTCMQWDDGSSLAIVPMNRAETIPGGFNHLIAHEAAGHGFGLFADEYIGNGSLIPSENTVTTEQINYINNSHLYGRNLNVTASQDPNTVYWKDLIGREGYELVGLYEGGFHFRYGVWRCEQRNCMMDNILYFNAACRMAIVQRIKKIAGEPFDLEDFISKDVQRAPLLNQLRIFVRNNSTVLFPPAAPPVLMDK